MSNKARQFALARHTHQMPPATTQAANAAGAAWRAGKALVSGQPVQASAETVLTRLSICNRCDHWQCGRCDLCGCYTAMKIRLATEECPVGKWGAEVQGADEE